MFSRTTPVLCLLLLFLFAVPAPRLRPAARADRPALSRSTAASLAVRIPAVAPADTGRSPERAPAIRARTMRAVLRELLPVISLVTVLPVPVHVPGPSDAASFSFGPYGNRVRMSGSRILYSGLSPPAVLPVPYEERTLHVA